MDNVIQNININDIIPIDNNINTLELNNLIDSIKKYGIIEPLLVRPNNGKYEIVVGNKIYQAAKQAGINELPAIIKNIDDNLINDYRAVRNMSQDDNPQINKKEILSDLNSENYNSDIINLSELNKEEYEREDVKMNNELNTNLMNENMGVNPTTANQEATPTFGGKFFPSLEDEPTNMNMGGMNINQASPAAPVTPAPSNLIDLTDSSDSNQMQQMDNITSPINPGIPTPEAPVMDSTMNMPNQSIMQQEVVSPIGPQMDIPNQNMNNTINIGDLSANYNPAPQMDAQPESPQINPAINLQNPQVEPTPQFDMSQTLDPNPIMSPDIGLSINANNVDPMMTNEQVAYNPTIDMNMNQPINTPEVAPQEEFNQQPMMEQPKDQINNNNQEVVPEAPRYNEMGSGEEKNLSPVINTIRDLVGNLGSFGYGINISEEDYQDLYRITIDIGK